MSRPGDPGGAAAREACNQAPGRLHAPTGVIRPLPCGTTLLMVQFTRRALLAGCAAMIPLDQAAAQPSSRRNLLASAWPAARLAETLPARERVHPFPTAAERTGWEALPRDARAALLETGEKQLPEIGRAHV